MTAERRICPWADHDPASLHYHDTEWGIPLHDEQRLFELVILEGMQAGLSWSIVLNKRQALRQALAGFDPLQLAAWNDGDRQVCLEQPGIIHNRRKIIAATTNARAYLDLCRSSESLDRYLWQWVDGTPVINHWQNTDEIPTQTPLSEKLSLDLKRRGFSYVGPTICYALMQAAGLVCDHLAWCDRHPDNLSGQADQDLST